MREDDQQGGHEVHEDKEHTDFYFQSQFIN